ncbi:MAG TPA: type II toxin-antitoxin system RelE/ParE family toxin [Stellaceae bacterium]|nr:type II toxin-antitoxin system RelE/ParE family toxin [Stellaceae bacterium]
MKLTAFLGSSLADIRGFPVTARREVGYQLDRVQRGLEPNDWKPLTVIGRGAREIRVRDATGAFRVIYVARLEDIVYVLHAFQKKTQKTSKRDIELAAFRLRQLMERR